MSRDQTGSVSFNLWLTSLRGNMPGLDGLRGIAILLVIWHNAGTNGDRALDGAIVKINQLLLNAGWVGVQLFFVLSGFLITGILLNSKGQKKQIRNFYFRRVLRIFPLYYAVLAMVFIVLPGIGYSFWPSAEAQQQQLWYWLYLVNWINPFVTNGLFPHFWSLAIEEQFYLAWPFIVVYLSTNRIVKVCLFLIVSAILSRYFIVAFYPAIAEKAAYTFTVVRWDALAIGAALAVMTREHRVFAWLCRYSEALLLSLSVIVAAQIVYHKNFAAVGAGSIVFNQTLIALWFALVLFLSVVPAKSGYLIYYHKLLELTLLRVLAKYSYAIYIIHLSVLKLWFATFAVDTKELGGLNLLLAINYNCLMILAISLVFGFFSWHLLEKPMLELKRFFPQLKQSP